MELNTKLIDVTGHFGALRFVFFNLRCRSVSSCGAAGLALAGTVGTSVGFPHRWQFRVIPTAAALTTSGLAQCWHLKRTSAVSFLACGRTGFIINLTEQRLYQAGRRAGAATCSESKISRQFDAFY